MIYRFNEGEVYRAIIPLSIPEELVFWGNTEAIRLTEIEGIDIYVYPWATVLMIKTKNETLEFRTPIGQDVKKLQSYWVYIESNKNHLTRYYANEKLYYTE